MEIRKVDISGEQYTIADYANVVMDNSVMIDGEKTGCRADGVIVSGDKAPLPYHQTVRDIHVIPDTRNTGCSGTLTDWDDVLDASEYSLSDTPDYLHSKTITNGLMRINQGCRRTFENLNFVGKQLYFGQSAYENPHFEFINCHFSNYATVEETYLYYSFQITDASNATITFRNCTFSEIGNTVNATTGGYGAVEFYNCRAENSQCDGFKLSNGVKLYDCYAADIGYGVAQEMHADGAQFTSGAGCYINGFRADNIHIAENNLDDDVNGNGVVDAYQLSNAGLYIDFDQIVHDVTHASFDMKNIYINGGGHTLYIITGKGNIIDDVKLDNAEYGCSYHYSPKYIQSEYAGYVTSDNYKPASKAYVTSVWKEADGVHFLATNFVNSQRTLLIRSDNGLYERVVPKCPTYWEYPHDGSWSYEDMPYNLEYVIPDCNWLVVYDGSESLSNQIRFVDFRNIDPDEEMGIINGTEETF